MPARAARILIVDDEKSLCQELCEELADGGFDTSAANDATTALELIRKQSFDVCISDINLPDLSGIELLKQIQQISSETLVIMITAHGDLSTAIEALRHGASDYVLKPLLIDDLEAKTRRLVGHRRLLLENRNLRRAVESQSAPDTGSIIGTSVSMRQVLDLVERVAPTDSTVLVLGESGTGKELIAHAIHARSQRAQASLVPINCAAIPEPLLESELFGHKKGAFTGADQDKEGLLKTADDGTIFLDEIGEMPLTVQAKLLRAIENREIQPVGSVRRIPIHARIIAATNQNLLQRSAEGLFREDLYYRLAVMEIEVPPLRERREDIPALTQHFISKYAKKLRRDCAGVHSEVMRLFVGHNWKGNVRELENVIERAVILTTGTLIEPSDLPAIVRNAPPVDPESSLRLGDATRRAERLHINKVLDMCDGDKKQAAELLGISLSSLYGKLAKD